MKILLNQDLTTVCGGVVLCLGRVSEQYPATKLQLSDDATLRACFAIMCPEHKEYATAKKDQKHEVIWRACGGSL